MKNIIIILIAGVISIPVSFFINSTIGPTTYEADIFSVRPCVQIGERHERYQNEKFTNTSYGQDIVYPGLTEREYPYSTALRGEDDSYNYSWPYAYVHVNTIDRTGVCVSGSFRFKGEEETWLPTMDFNDLFFDLGHNDVGNLLDSDRLKLTISF